jgi:hypothetical protein
MLSASFAQNKLQESIVVNNLNAVPNGAYVQLTWTPESQFTSGNYIVERSKNGNEFVEVSRTQASTSQVEFLETDFLPFDGLSYYRLRLVDNSGQVRYSNMVPVKFMDGKGVSPATSEIKNQTTVSGGILVVVRDQNGTEYFSKIEIAASSDPLAVVDLEEELTKGVTYHIVACSDQNYFSKNIIVR